MLEHFRFNKEVNLAMDQNQQRDDLIVFFQALFIVIVICSILMLSIPYKSLLKDISIIAILSYLINKYMEK